MERICVDHIPKLKTLQAHVERHIKHQFTSEMSQESTVVNLGTVSANPASTARVIDIMTNLHKYVPSKGNGLHTVVCNGDQLSVERMTHCKIARIRGATPLARLDGMVETPQEFHKCGIILQVTGNI